MNPQVKVLQVLAGFRLQLVFSTGEVRIFDLTPHLNDGVFRQLRDPASFASARVVAGSVEWVGDIDLSYDTLYLESSPVAESTARLL